MAIPYSQSRPQKGQTLTAATVRKHGEAIEAAGKARLGGSQWSVAGIPLGMQQGSEADCWAKGPSTTIAALGGTGEAQLYLDDLCTQLGPTVTVTNPTPDAVPANRLLRINLASLTALYWSCNAMS